jgi:hypothetical protein
MKSNKTWLLWAAICAWPALAQAQLRIVTNAEPQSIFFGSARNISATFYNPDEQEFKSAVRMRIYQATSATAVSLSEKPWKELRVLPHQTVLETAQLDFPFVKARTRFIIEWAEAANRVIGKTEVLVYPTNLLEELGRLVDDSGENLGVLDPQRQFKPALKRSAIKFIDLGESELDEFSGKLAIVGLCGPDDPEWNGLTARISKLAQKGTPVVWVPWPPRTRDHIRPSFYVVPKNAASVVVVSPEVVADLAENPQSQLNLVYLCRLALHPQPELLPDLSLHLNP